MAAHHVGQGRAQRVGVNATAQPQCHGHVVNRYGPVQLGEEPQPALGVRQRNDRGPLPRHQWLRSTRIPVYVAGQLRNRRRLE